MINETEINKIILEILTLDPRNAEHKQIVKKYKEELKKFDLQINFFVNDKSIEHKKTYKKIYFKASGSRYYPQWDSIHLGGYKQLRKEDSFKIWDKVNYINYLNTPYNRNKNYGRNYYKELKEYEGFQIVCQHNPITDEYDKYVYSNNKITNFLKIKINKKEYEENVVKYIEKADKEYKECMRLANHYSEKVKEEQKKLDKMLKR